MLAFAHLSDQVITLKRNEYLTLSGRVDTHIYYIESGCLRAFVLDDAEEQTIRFGYQDNLMGALDSFFTGQPTQFYIQAIKKTVVRVIAKPQIEAYLVAADEHRVYWTKILEAMVVQQLEREIDLLTTAPRDRYQRVLQRSPQLFQEVPSRYIAQYLRMSPETLSRLKKS